MHHQSGFLPELTAKIRKSLKSDSLLDEKVKKCGEKLGDKRKKPIFAASNVCFDYAAECGEQDLIDTTPFLNKESLHVALLSFCIAADKGTEEKRQESFQ